MVWNRSSGCPTHCFSLVVCRHPHTHKYLAVEEVQERGWWLPGGFVEPTDSSMAAAAVRETWEEAGVAVMVRGILRVEHSMNRHGARHRVVFYAEPTDPDDGTTKQVADLESLRAEWLTVDELRAKEELPPPHGLRGPELFQWATYVERGGMIFPLDVFTDECAPIPTVELA
jgi:ADP-ribose pyrophosphatase YjhB (NUDIX family)